MNKRVSLLSVFLFMACLPISAFASSSGTEISQESAAKETITSSGQSIQGKTVKVNGLDVHYFSYGFETERDTDKPAIIFVHGWAATGMEGTLIGERLSQGYRFYAPDFPGLGGSDSLPEYSMDSATEWVENFAKAVGAGRFILVGHSLGGHIAARYALEHPETLEKLILISPVGFPKEEGYLYSVLSKNDLIIKIGMLFMTPFTYSSGVILNLPDWGRFSEEINEYGGKSASSPKGKASLTQITYNILGTKTVENDLGNMKVPVLLIWGREDRVLPFSWSEKFLEGLPPGTEFLAVDRCGHTPMLEYPEIVSSRILAFLAE